VLLVDGRMDGVWSHEVKGGRLKVTVEPFVPLTAWAKKGVKSEAESLAEFLGAGEVDVTYAG
jgi:hypothetical protein